MPISNQWQTDSESPRLHWCLHLRCHRRNQRIQEGRHSQQDDAVFIVVLQQIFASPQDRDLMSQKNPRASDGRSDAKFQQVCKKRSTGDQTKPVLSAIEPCDGIGFAEHPNPQVQTQISNAEQTHRRLLTYVVGGSSSLAVKHNTRHPGGSAEAISLEGSDPCGKGICASLWRRVASSPSSPAARYQPVLRSATSVMAAAQQPGQAGQQPARPIWGGSTA